jgi:hypothetical protein
MILRNILIASCLLVTSMASQATLISYNGYERDSASSVVKGGGLEWLMWDVTNGMSIASALQAYSGNGWVLANSSNMAALFNSFKFGKTDWNASATNQYAGVAWTTNEVSVHKDFMQLFGITQLGVVCGNALRGCYEANDNLIASLAMYGEVTGGKLTGGLAEVGDDRSGYLPWGDKFQEGHWAILTNDGVSDDIVNQGIGVALVRPAAVTPNPVTIPNSISLLALGLVALGFRRRQALRR